MPGEGLAAAQADLLLPGFPQMLTVYLLKIGEEGIFRPVWIKVDDAGLASGYKGHPIKCRCVFCVRAALQCGGKHAVLLLALRSGENVLQEVLGTKLLTEKADQRPAGHV